MNPKSTFLLLSVLGVWGLSLCAGASGGELFERPLLVLASDDFFATNLSADDVTGDGCPDLSAVPAGTSTSQVYLGLNNCSGLFPFSAQLETGNAPGNVAIADVSGNGCKDIITANRLSDSISILINQCDLSFSSPTVLTNVGDGPQSVVARDFDDDGDLDIAVANAQDGTVTIMQNNGVGAFPFTSTINLPSPLSSDADISAADIDADGFLDIALATVGGCDPGATAIVWGEAGGVFNDITLIDTGCQGDSIAIGDLDGDDDLDMAVSFNSENTIIAVLRNQGDRKFLIEELKSDGGFHLTDLAVADVDGDGDLDICAGKNDFNLPENFLLIRLNDGMSFDTEVLLPLGADNFIFDIVAVDADIDGRSDLYISTSAGVFLLRNIANQPLIPGDLNGDGIVDGADLGLLLGAFNSTDPNADLNADGIVNGADLGILLGNFGAGG